MDLFGVTVNCGSLIIDNCKDLGIPWGEDWTFQMLLGDLIDAAQALVKYGVQYVGSSLSDNLLKGINALRCALTNLGTNAWNLIAALYWTLIGVGQGKTVKEYLDIGYEYICTCQEDAKEVIKMLGGDTDGGRSAYMLGTCSESGSVKKNDAQQKQEERRKAKVAANLKALKDAARARIEKEKEGELNTIAKQADGKKALEQKQLEAFKAFQAEARAQEDIAEPTAAQKKKLEDLQMQYEATKKVKEQIVIKEVAAAIRKKKQENGLEGIAEVTAAAAEKQAELAKKLQEFPDDEDTALLLKAAETEMQLIEQSLKDLAASDEVSVRETEKIRALEKAAKEKEAYNRLYAEALPIARGGDEMELDTYFAALESGFKKVESEYNWAVANKKPNAKDLGEAFDKALLIYNAALDVRFDVTEAVRQEQLIPEVTLTEDEQDEIAAPIKAARAKEGGEKDVKKIIRGRFDSINGLETKLSKNKADSDV
jgi:hypothetical protein